MITIERRVESPGFLVSVSTHFTRQPLEGILFTFENHLDHIRHLFLESVFGRKTLMSSFRWSLQSFVFFLYPLAIKRVLQSHINSLWLRTQLTNLHLDAKRLPVGPSLGCCLGYLSPPNHQSSSSAVMLRSSRPLPNVSSAMILPKRQF